MTEPIEHQSIYPDGHNAWVPGTTCDECRDRYRANLATNKAVRIDVAQQIGFTHPSPAIQEFLETGDPEVFDRQKAKGRHNA